MAMFTVAACWGAGLPAVKVALSDVAPSFFIFVRFIFAALLCLPVAWGRLAHAASLRAGLGLGAFSSILYLLHTSGIQNIPASRGAFLFGSGITLVPFMAAAAGQTKLHFMDVLATLVCLTGLWVLTGGVHPEELERGDVLVLLAAVIFAASIVFLQHVTKDTHAAVITFYTCIVTSLAALGSWLVIRPSPIGFSSRGIALALACAVFVSIVPIFLQARYQRKISSTHAALILALEPILGAAFSCLVLGEPIGWRLVVGGSVVVLAVMLPHLGALRTLGLLALQNHVLGDRPVPPLSRGRSHHK